ncbi:hypothetical protein EBS80_00575 [bacterium]|nr:hypothetical protein [bacterium]
MANLSDTGPTGCDEGYSAITDEDGNVAYCITVGEVEIVSAESWGSSDTHVSGATGASGVVIASGVGAMPSWGMSYDQAVSMCASAGGSLPTWEEWRDANDGTVGDGGTAYPYGNEYDQTACATDDNPDVTSPSSYPTGSFPRCVSPYGVYDGIGNLWEWYRSGEYVDIGAWFTRARKTFGIDVSAFTDPNAPGAETDQLEIAPDAIEKVQLNMQGVAFTLVHPDATASSVPIQYAVTAIDGYVPSPPVGFLIFAEDGMSGENVLPVVMYFLDADNPTVGTLYVGTVYDGAELPGKAGGAYYTEPTPIAPSVGHYWAFNGTIGFRCVQPPLALN